MKKISLIIAIFSTVLTNAQDTWAFDASHSTVGFSISHMVISEIDGNFNKFEGSLSSSKDDLSDASINFTIDVASIDTADKKRDAHLLAADFFDVVNHPEISFKSTSISKKNDADYTLIGQLTMHGFTKEIKLSMQYGGTIKDPWGNIKAGIKITGKLNRTAYGLTYNSVMEAGGLMIGEDIEILCKMELIKK
ncbi:MAG: YceI family protein [Flavobacteriaceae bacterium]|nr:YceI family protein [Flavobacteriaceae bacterium]